MANVIRMPKLSDTMETGKLVKWLKNEGDSVEPGDLIAEVETDKATMQVENFEEGVILKHYVGAGEQVAVGNSICAIGESGEEPPEDSKPEDNTTAKAPQKEASKGQEASKEKASTAPAPHVSEPSGGKQRVKASPLARKIAQTKGISLTAIKGSGPGGRIRKADVLAALEKGPPISSTTASPFSVTGTPIAEEKAVPVSTMRATIARRLLESKTQIPHFYLDLEIDADPLADLRATLNKGLADTPPEKGGIKLTLNDFILKACAEALREVPAINVSWQEDAVQQWGGVHLAFGVAVDDGLVTPVIRNAHAKGLREIGAEARDLIAKARTKTLKPEEMVGSTFTVTNLGMFGVSGFFGIINPPNAGILCVGAAIKKPVVNADDTIAVGHRMSLGFCGDHRAIDGASAAQFLSVLKQILETPALMLV